MERDAYVADCITVVEARPGRTWLPRHSRSRPTPWMRRGSACTSDGRTKISCSCSTARGRAMLNRRPSWPPPSSATRSRPSATRDAPRCNAQSCRRAGSLCVSRGAWGCPAPQDVLQESLQAAVRAAKLPPNTRFHDLRHTCAAMCIALGADPKTIQERLGHSSITVTLDVDDLSDEEEAAFLDAIPADMADPRRSSSTPTCSAPTYGHSPARLYRPAEGRRS